MRHTDCVKSPTELDLACHRFGEWVQTVAFPMNGLYETPIFSQLLSKSFDVGVQNARLDFDLRAPQVIEQSPSWYELALFLTECEQKLIFGLSQNDLSCLIIDLL